MALEKLTVKNLEALLQAVGQRKDNPGGVFLLLCGDVVPESGESWCSDCVKGDACFLGGVASPTHMPLHTDVVSSSNVDIDRTYEEYNFSLDGSKV